MVQVVQSISRHFEHSPEFLADAAAPVAAPVAPVGLVDLEVLAVPVDRAALAAATRLPTANN